MKTVIKSLVVMLIGTLTVYGTQVVDDFDRENTVQSTNGAYIGTGWVASDGTTEWSVTSSRVIVDSSTLQSGALLYNTQLETISGAGGSFSCSLDVRSNTGGRWVGAAFNIQDDNNYYAIRIKANSTAYQCLRIVDGELVAIVNKTDATTNFVSGSFYRVTVTSDTPYEFNFTITEPGSETVLNPTTGFSDGQSNFSDGYAGLYVGSTSASLQWDNFSLEVLVPQESVIDDFIGTNTVSGLGEDWAGDELFFINNDKAATSYSSNTAIPDVAWNTSVETVSGGGTNLSLSATVSCSSGGRLVGVAFNVQNQSNYYALVVQTGQSVYRIAQMSDGTISWLVNKSDAISTFDAGTEYDLTVTSDTLGTYDFIITESGGSTVLNPTTSYTDPTPFSSGYAGLFSIGNSGTYLYDNFELSLFYDVPVTNTLEVGTIFIEAEGAGVVVSWTNGSDSTTYSLQGMTDLNNGSWSNLVAGISGENGAMSVTSSVVGNVAFYRVVGE